MSEAGRRSPEAWFHEVATHYVEAQILFHLNRAGVFRLLDAEGPLGADAIAARLGLEPRVLGALLDYVAGVDELLARDGAGRFGLGEFGRRVLERFGRREADGPHFNFFDVRVGAYGPVWEGLGRLLRGAVYGRDVTRAGDAAAEAVYKLVDRIEPTLARVAGACRATSLVELGVSTGLLERLGARDPGLRCYGVDRSAAALDRARGRAEAAGFAGLRALPGDVFEPDGWLDAIDAGRGPGLLFSVHFHEFVAGDGGPARLARALRRVGERLPGWRVVAFEQPLLPDSARGQIAETLWLYAQSNVLIHHLIGNGRILPESGWVELLAEAGCEPAPPEPLDYLGYLAFAGAFKGAAAAGP
ncbi:MAG TPA: class I SAM-dependent methyltransferase [Polyangiaceae bacterium]|nr:class I SAM-dependent methyltransferase [Polyangiaceae bacterium]